MFILGKEDQGFNDLESLENFNFIYHEGWHTSLVQIADNLTENKHKYWVYDVPKLEINCYGFKNPKTIENINYTFDELEIEVQTICH